MGIYDRDYYRDAPSGGGLFGGVGAVCKKLIAINVLVFLAQVFLVDDDGHGITEWLSMNGSVLQGQVWRLLTYAFCHSQDDPFHLLFNMMFLWMMGQQVESIYGGREFLRFYLAGAVASAACFLLVGLLAGGRVHGMVGASGAICSVVVVTAMYYPTQQIAILGVIPIELRWLVLIYLAYDLMPVVLELSGRPSDSGVAHAAHLGGMLYGYLYKRFDLRLSRLFGDFDFARQLRSLTRRRPPVKLYAPPVEEVPENLEERVDEILAKITAQGESSLTDAERRILTEASERYKRKS